MSAAYQIWWRFLMDLRPLLRYGSDRFFGLSTLAIVARVVLHVAAGNPVQVMVVLVGLMALAGGVPLVGVVVGTVLLLGWLEMLHQVVRVMGGPTTVVAMVAWREGWRVRRRWPADWAAAAVKTAHVQAEVGTSAEPKLGGRTRPVADHPKLSWYPRLEWPVVSWWVGPPPGRSFTAFDELTEVLAANISHCVHLDVVYDQPGDSWGRLIVTFAEAPDRSEGRHGFPPPHPDGAVIVPFPLDRRRRLRIDEDDCEPEEQLS